MNDVPWNFVASQRKNNIFYPPNVTSWINSCDSGVIADIKNRHKYWLLKGVLSFYQLKKNNRNLLNLEGSNFCRGSICRLETLLNAANYAKDNGTKLLTIKTAIINEDLRIS